ncbi:hypothetical protein DBZ36_17750 [Alginatibacterium sediminis]|uniref:Uncharacterized protein n=1 Tax=Alginatibacterium sediminis TaxID=2164068 RepID=A0A420E7V8_9ALTE|nr:hypothetical protein DBZ36_17750 [Alginatibacterium sediminis]
MIFVSHKLSIDKQVLSKLTSNHSLNILVILPRPSSNNDFGHERHDCSCVLFSQALLFKSSDQTRTAISIIKIIVVCWAH